MKKIKVLVIVNSHFGFDGISNVATNYYLYQDHKEVKIDFVCINEPSHVLLQEVQNNGDEIFILRCRNRNPFLYMYYLCRIFLRKKYDIVHVHGNSSTMFFELGPAMLTGVKVRIAHSHNTTCNHRKLDKLLRPLFNFSYTSGFACGKEAGEWMFRDKKVRLISNGVDPSKFSYDEQIREQMRTKYNLAGKMVIGHLGRFSLQKNHKMLIDIFEKILEKRNDVYLVLLGDGELKDDIYRYCKLKHMPVHFVGNSNDVNKWLQAFDLVIFPSLFEGLPLCLVEAQAAGLDCFISDRISSDVNITDLVRFIDINLSAEEWSSIILSKQLSNRLQSKQRVIDAMGNKHFDIRKNCEELLQIYKLLLNEKK